MWPGTKKKKNLVNGLNKAVLQIHLLNEVKESGQKGKTRQKEVKRETGQARKTDRLKKRLEHKEVHRKTEDKNGGVRKG